MYITADADSEVVLASKMPNFRSVESVDVKKADRLITTTPDGRQRLLTYLNKIERNLAKEISGRRANIAAIRAHMARNMAYNQRARNSMKKALLAKMAINAKRAKHDLDRAMRRTQATFAKVAAVENRRNAMTMERSSKTRKIMRENKRAAAGALKLAVLTQQRALASLSQVTNAKIKKTNKHIAINAAHISLNARKARTALEKAMGAFDKKMSNIHDEALKKRSKLVAQANAQDKAFRSYANNRIRAIVASTAAQFQKVRKQMAKDRLKADNALLKTTTRLDAALKANRALQDKRFRRTVANLNDAKAEANRRIKAARASFKARINSLDATVKYQVTKLNSRVDTLSQTINRNKLEQAAVNRKVHAEMKRMIALGNKRYNEHIKKDKDLAKLMNKHKAQTLRQMNRLAETFNVRMRKISKQMAKDRRHAANRLKSATNKLYATLNRNALRQHYANKRLTTATQKAAQEARSELRKATIMFTGKLAKMHTVAVRSARRNQNKIYKLTGIVAANAIKDARGRRLLAQTQKATKTRIKLSISKAIKQGEKHAMRVIKKMTKINKKTREALGNRISTQISKLRKETQKSLFKLGLENKAARAELKKFILREVSDAAKKAKADTNRYVQYTTGRVMQLDNLLRKNNAKNSAERAELRARVAKNMKTATKNLALAVQNQNAALIAEKVMTAKMVRKTHNRITKYARQMYKDARAVSAKMKANEAALVAKLNGAKRAAAAGVAAANAASLRRYRGVVNKIIKGVKAARRKADARFGKAYASMARQRMHMDRQLSASTTFLNNKIAELHSLSDVRFKKVTKNISALKAKTRADVALARKNFTTKIVALKTAIKDQESRLQSEVNTVSKNLKGDKAAQLKINKRVAKEIDSIIKKANARHSASVRARGKLRLILDNNKKVASAEVAALAKRSTLALSVLRAQQARYRRSAAIALTKATKKLHRTIHKAQKVQRKAEGKLAGSLAAAKAETKAKLASAKLLFKSKVIAMTNLMTMNRKKYERGLQRLTGVTRDWRKASAKDRLLIKAQTKAMNRDLSSKLARAVQLGSAKARNFEASMKKKTAAMKKKLGALATRRVEAMANAVYKTIQSGRHKIADNYLSLKAYAATSKDALIDYMKKSERRGLSSIGDLLKTVGEMATVKVGKAAGVGAGSKTLPQVFGSSKVKVKNAVTSINFLVDDYTRTLTQVQQRWPMGLGKYLLAKVETNMQKSGILEVDRVSGKSGNFVFVNAQAVGLSSKLSDFASLAVRMTQYQNTLTAMANAVAGKAKKSTRKFLKPPEWQGN
jgi:hypothetical protein